MPWECAISCDEVIVRLSALLNEYTLEDGQHKETTYGGEEEVVMGELRIADRRERDTLPLRINERRGRRVAYSPVSPRPSHG